MTTVLAAALVPAWLASVAGWAWWTLLHEMVRIWM
jgi:hypothetical protein